METGPVFLTESDLSDISTVKSTQYGRIGYTEDGRMYRYVKFGGTATINPGLLLVAPAAPANSTGLAISTANTTAQLSANSRSLLVTNGATAVTQDQFQFLELIISAGGSYNRRLEGNSAAAGAGAITLQLAEPLPPGMTALIAGTDTVNLRLSEYNGPTASLTQALAVGVTNYAVPNTASVTNYGWLQTGGQAYVAATSAVKGQGVTQDQAGTAGFVKTSSAFTDGLVATARESQSGSKASVDLMLF